MIPNKKGLDIDQIAEALEWPLSRVRRYIWKVSIKPITTEWRWFDSARGKRKASCNIYDHNVIEQLKKVYTEEHQEK